jgi:ABC-type Mn2+/Zn2+ transport system permease subunit
MATLAISASTSAEDPMLKDFLASWPLFAEAWLSSWLIAALLSLLGVAVLARNQIFLGAAMSQAATAGVALALAFAGAHGSAWVARADAVFAVVGAVATAFAAGFGRGHRESVTGWIFLATSAAAVLLVAHSPHGMEEVNRLLASSLIGATWADVTVFAVLLLVVVAVTIGFGARLRTLLLDPSFATAIGISVLRWEAILAITLGLALGWSLHVAGTLYAFGTLILPAMAARQVSRELGTMTILAPIIAVVAAVVASVLANAWDLPPAQVTVAVLALSVGLAAGIRLLGRVA